MDRFDEYAAHVAEGIGEGAGDVARGAIADIGNSYQQILTQDAGIGPPEGLTGDMITTHDPEPPAPASDRELQALIDAQQAEARLAPEPEPEAAAPQPGLDMER